MCPMCEKRAQLLLQQQTIVESSPIGEQFVPGDSLSLFRNPFKACKHLTHRCCSPLCESQRTSIASGRRSSAIIAPVPSTPEHSGELTYLVSESPLSADDSRDAEPRPVKHGLRNGLRKSRKRRGLLKRLKAWADPDPIGLLVPSSNESSFAACGRKVMAVADELARDSDGHNATVPSAATLLAAETDLDGSTSEAVTETNVSETTTMVSMMNLHGSVSSRCEMTTTSYRGSATLKSSAYDDDASSFAIVPRTSMNSSYVGRDGASDTSGLSDRFGELDIGYLSLEESGEGPEFDDTVSISSDQSEHLNLDIHQQALDDTVSESDLDGLEYSISTDSPEWVTETDDAASILQRSRTHHNRDNNNTGNNNNNAGNNNNNTGKNNNTPPPLPPQPLDHPVPTPKRNDALSVNKNPLFVKHDTTTRKPKTAKETQPQSPEIITEYLCSRCGRTESGTQPQNVTTTKTNVVPMSTYFMAGEDQAVVAAKVVVLLGKYGNRKGLRVSGLQSNPTPNQTNARKLERLRSMVCPHNDAVSAFQNEVARMMLEGAAVPDLDMDVEQFLAGYMKLNSPFYIDLIEDFFKSVCVDCFGHMEKVVQRRGSCTRAPHQTPAYSAVLRPRKSKSIAGKGHSGKLQQ